MSSQSLGLDLNLALTDDSYGSRSRNEEYIANKEFLTNYSKRYHTEEDFVLKRRIGSGVAFVSLIAENLLCHPFQVLRRQCQVNHTSQKFHLLPFTLFPTIYRLHQHQGLTTLWKGLGSVLLVRGISLGVEDLISKVTPWPKEIRWDSSLKHFFQHNLLKCFTLAIVTPFNAASFVETVQSEIASEKPGILDVFREGFLRIINWNGGVKGRMLPIWVLVVPTIALGLSKYLFSMLVKGVSTKILKARFKSVHEENGAYPRDTSAALQDLNVTASLIANIASDVVFFPCETIVHRLYLQGTRTIVDNLDSGSAVLPILTNFVGAMDCYENCLFSEGNLGFYKGFGALMMQYTIHIALIQCSRFILTEIVKLIHRPKPKQQQRVPTQDISPAALSNWPSSHRNYLLP